MTLSEIEKFLRNLGAPEGQLGNMARQLDKRAHQLSDERNQSYEEALAYLIGLMKQGWAAQAKAENSNGVEPK